MDYHFRHYFLSVVKSVFKKDIFYCTDTHLSCELVLVKSWLFGNRLISTGYLTDGGIFGDTEQSQDILLQNILTIAQKYHVDYIELRGGIKPNTHNLIIRDNIYANFIKDMTQIDDILTSIPRKKRADIRKALNNSDLSFTDAVTIDEFYALFSASQHEHGTPIHYKKYYQALHQNLQFTKIYGIKYKEKIVATCMVFFSNTQLIAYYGAADKEFKTQHVYDLLYYHLMQTAKNKKLEFNFGRSKYHTGSFDYKTFWGFSPIPTTHYIIPVSNKPIPDLRANNPEFSKKIALWRKMPRWFVHIIGGFILKHIA
jgi:FemAB-related protein (PEP-CTERM system-associated)